MAYLAVAGTLPTGASRLPLRILGAYPVVEDVYLSGSGPFRFLVDTGAQSSVITARLAARLAMRPTQHLTVVTALGSREVAGGLVSEISLGNAQATNVEFLWYDLPKTLRVDGVLGENFLARFNYRLDYEHRRLVIPDAPPPLEGTHVPLEHLEGRAAIAAGGLKLILDSGASNVILFEKPGRPRTANAIAAGSANLVTSAGGGRVASARLWELRIGSLTLRNLTVVLVPDRADRQEDGLLPTCLFSSLYVNNREAYVVFARPK